MAPFLLGLLAAARVFFQSRTDLALEVLALVQHHNHTHEGVFLDLIAPSDHETRFRLAEEFLNRFGPNLFPGATLVHHAIAGMNLQEFVMTFLHLVPALLTLAETATVLPCSKSHASKLARGRVRGAPPLPVVRLGRRVLLRRDDLFLWLSQNFAGSVVR